MGRNSSIKDLDPKIREAVDDAIREGRATIDDIVGLIDDLGGEASRSAVGRYKKTAEERMRQWRDAQEISKVWIGRLEEDPDGDVGRLVSEMLKTVANITVGSWLDEGEPVKADQIMLLSKAIKDMAGADKLSLERELKIRQEVAKKAADEVDKIASQGGMNEKTANEIRERILGVAKK